MNPNKFQPDIWPLIIANQEINVALPEANKQLLGLYLILLIKPR